MAKRLDYETCLKLYKECNTPERVIKHCKAVSDTACTVGEELNKHGHNLDIDLIRGAALAHDVLRVKENHGLEGAKLLMSLGYKDEAEIVRVHMYYQFNDFEHINETDLVCLGDRLVKEHTYVGLDERIEYIINKAGNDPEVTKRILVSKEKTRLFMDKIEKEIGQTIDSLFLERQ